jgi:hypothetical protein
MFYRVGFRLYNYLSKATTWPRIPGTFRYSNSKFLSCYNKNDLATFGVMALGILSWRQNKSEFGESDFAAFDKSINFYCYF